MADWSVEKFSAASGEEYLFGLARELKEELREEDSADLLLAGGSFNKAIIGSIAETEEGFAFRGASGELLCLAGLCREFPTGVGRCVWMLGTKKIQQGRYVKQLLMRASREIIACWVKEHGLIWNVVNRDNKKSIRWLSWLGARFLFKQADRDKRQLVEFYIDGRR